MIPGERFRIHDRVRALVAEVRQSARPADHPSPARTATSCAACWKTKCRNLPRHREIRSIAREPGEPPWWPSRRPNRALTRWALRGHARCVIQAIVRELHDEKIDVIEWNPTRQCLSPPLAWRGERRHSTSAAGGKTATVVVSEDQPAHIGQTGFRSLACGLTGWRIDIKSISECASIRSTTQNDPALEQILEAEQKVIPQVEEALANKASGRPLAPEDYDLLIRFIDRVEKRIVSRAEAARKVSEDKLAELRSSIPAQAFETNILDSDLPEHISIILQEAGFETLGDLALQMKKNSDETCA